MEEFCLLLLLLSLILIGSKRLGRATLEMQVIPPITIWKGRKLFTDEEKEKEEEEEEEEKEAS